jgi:hypothetical protein
MDLLHTGCALLVSGRAGMREVIGAAGECAGKDDRGFDAPNEKTAPGAAHLGVQQQFGGWNGPYLAPYFASKAGTDAMAVRYARELALWGRHKRGSTPVQTLSGPEMRE